MKTDDFCAALHAVEFHNAPGVTAQAFDIALHRARPATDDQTSHEITLPGYARVVVPRTARDWTIDKRIVCNAGDIRFPTVTGGRDTATWLSIGIQGVIRRVIPLKAPVLMTENRRVIIKAGQIEVEDQA